jgi:hypothetical protein
MRARVQAGQTPGSKRDDLPDVSIGVDPITCSIGLSTDSDEPRGGGSMSKSLLSRLSFVHGSPLIGPSAFDKVGHVSPE